MKMILSSACLQHFLYKKYGNTLILHVNGLLSLTFENTTCLVLYSKPQIVAEYYCEI
jgi:hypothetical protein